MTAPATARADRRSGQVPDLPYLALPCTRSLDRLAGPRYRPRGEVGGRVGGAFPAGCLSRDHLGSVAAACARLPHGTVCLLSAAHLHRLVTAVPSTVWLAIAPGMSAPSGEDPPVRILRWSFPGALDAGVLRVSRLGVGTRITSPGRTVIDLLRLANHVGGEETGFVAGRRYLARGGEISELLDLVTATNAPANVRRVTRFLELHGGSRA